ncbi:MAG: PilN domain-containing protein [Nitrospirae bacterium]|nr:PilN domain-containing protein [Nitrospirota bacterium]
MTIDVPGRPGSRRGSRTAIPAVPSLRLALAPPVVSTLRTVQWSLIGLTVLSLGLAGWWWQEIHDDDAMAERYEFATARTETLNRQFAAQLTREGLTLPGDQIAMLQGKVVFANLLADKRAFSWTRLLSDLEETVPAHLSIGSVKLDFQQSKVIVEGLARNLQDVNAFVRTLQAHPAFQKALLSKHEVRRGRDGGSVAMPVEGETDTPSHGVEFTLAVEYRAALLNGNRAE